MPRSASIALLLLSLLLVVVGKAAGVSAWVLWVEEERFSDPKGDRWGGHTSNWRVLGAWSRETDCRRTLRETLERVKLAKPPSDADLFYKVTGDSVTFLYYPKDAGPTGTVTRSQVLHYVCLPDTVDPRGGGEKR